MNKYCNCGSVLSIKIAEGNLFLECYCGFKRRAEPDESLVLQMPISTEIIHQITKEEIINDNTNHTFPINCDCGSKIGVLDIIGENCFPIKICKGCMKSI
jgi:hypothetical protein